MSDSTVSREALTADQKALLRMVYGAQTTQAIYVAAKLGVPDMLKDGPRTPR